MTAAYDEVAEQYDGWYTGRPMLDDPVTIELLGDVSGRRVLDVACGQGWAARWLAAEGARVVALDISSRLLDIARRHERERPLGVAYLRADAQGVPSLATATFDGVLANGALMDIERLDTTVGGVARVLRPGGWFVFSITHPCFHAPHSGEMVDHDDRSWRRIVGGYFEEGTWEAGRHNPALPDVAYHRTLGTYVNTLFDNGLHLERLREVPREGVSPVWRVVPQMLYARCRKAAS
jgi:ubiquinone/menaquinone biosynthesis C-methylase UbiE